MNDTSAPAVPSAVASAKQRITCPLPMADEASTRNMTLGTLESIDLTVLAFFGWCSFKQLRQQFGARPVVGRIDILHAPARNHERLGMLVE